MSLLPAKVIHIDIDPAGWGKPYTRCQSWAMAQSLIDLLRRCQEVGECVAPTNTRVAEPD